MKVSFCTPLVFLGIDTAYTPSLRERLLSGVEKYFILGNTRVFELEAPEKVEAPFLRKGRMSSRTSSATFIILKIISYITIIIPVLMLLARIILKYPYRQLKGILPKQGRLTSIFKKDRATKLLDDEKKIMQGAPQEIFSIEVPSQRSPWVFSNMPQPIKTMTKRKDPKDLDEVAVKRSLENLCLALAEKKQLSDDFCTVGFSDDCIFFTIKEHEGIKFKAVRDNFYATLHKRAEGRYLRNSQEIIPHIYEMTQKMKEDMEEGSFTHLHLPRSRLFTVDASKWGTHHFIAEEELPIYPANQTHIVWKIQDQELQPAFRELVILIQKTGLHNVNPTKCSPFFENGKWLLALKDVSSREEIVDRSVNQPLLGLEQLIERVYSQESMEMILNQLSAKLQDHFNPTIERRAQELRIFRYHELYHGPQINPYGNVSPIDLTEADIEALDLMLDEKATLEDGSVITMQKAVNLLIQRLNVLLKKKKNNYSLYSHHILYNPIRTAASMPKDLGKISSEKSTNGNGNLNKLWIRQILNALVKQGYICSWSVVPGQIPDWSNSLNIWL